MIKISETKIVHSAQKGIDEFLKVFIDAYLEALGGNLSAENMHLLNGNQHTLLAYHFLREEVMHGGFVQLIQNGYGAYIFDNPTTKALKLFGASEVAKILYKAKDIYDSNREELERETTEEEFTAMYVDFEQFDELEEQFFEIEEEQTAIIAKYVDENIKEFGEIIS
ncbi:MAG: DMP19 family protein [Bacteroidales bacterium]|nr:DMP19 family protein [Bacteroidales bacterium]